MTQETDRTTFFPFCGPSIGGLLWILTIHLRHIFARDLLSMALCIAKGLSFCPTRPLTWSLIDICISSQEKHTWNSSHMPLLHFCVPVIQCWSAIWGEDLSETCIMCTSLSWRGDPWGVRVCGGGELGEHLWATPTAGLQKTHSPEPPPPPPPPRHEHPASRAARFISIRENHLKTVFFFFEKVVKGTMEDSE